MIETPRIVLRPMRAEDRDALLHIFADPLVMNAFGENPFNHHQMEQWVQRNLAHQDQYGYGLYSVVLKTDGVLVGDCGLTHMDIEGATEIELGYDFRSQYWHRGLATEAATAMRDYAFGMLGLPRMVSLIRQGNRASQRVDEKVGMRLEAVLTRQSSGYWLYACSCDDVYPQAEGMSECERGEPTARL